MATQTARKKREPKRLRPISIRLDDAMIEQLRGIAEAQNRPMANLITTVLKDWLASQPSAAEK